MDSVQELLRDKKNAIRFLLVGIIILLIPLGVNFIKYQQQFFSRADVAKIELVDGECVTLRNGKKVLICDKVPLKLVFPAIIHPTLAPTPSPTPTPTATPSASPSGSASPTASGSASPSPTPGAGTVIRVSGNTGEAIQAALRQVQNTGGAVFLPEGTYTISQKIKLYSNTTLFGTGPGRTILQATQAIVDANDPIVSNDSNRGQQNVTIRDMTLRGLGSDSGRNRCCPGLRYTNLDGGYIINVEVLNFSWVGIYLGYQEGKGVKNVRVSGCKSNNNKGSGLAIALGENNVVDSCEFTGNNNSTDPGKIDAAVNLELGVEGKISNNKILANRVMNNKNVGINIAAGSENTPVGELSTMNVSGNAICRNTVESNDDVGIADSRASANFYIANTIRNNEDRGDGKIVVCDRDPGGTGCIDDGNDYNRAIEDESPSATNPACDIPTRLRDLPNLPAVPAASILSPRVFNLASYFSGFRLNLPKITGTVFAQVANATGTISASPNPCTISAGAQTCTTTLNWTTSHAFHAKVRIKETNQAIVDDLINGSISYNNVTTAPITVELVAFDNSGEKILSSISVRGNASPTASPTPSPPSGSATPTPPSNQKYKLTGRVCVREKKTEYSNQGECKNGDIPLSDRTVLLFDGSKVDIRPGVSLPDSAAFKNTKTTRGGSYAFADISSGEYRVKHAIPEGYERLTDDSQPISLGKDTTWDFVLLGFKKFRLAESEAGLKDETWKEYKDDPTISEYLLQDDSPGTKKIWVEFLDLDGKTYKFSLNIEVVEKDPEIESVACELDSITKQNVKFVIKGQRFGLEAGTLNQTKVKAAAFVNNPLRYMDTLEWKKDQVVAILKKPDFSKEAEQTFQVGLVRADGQIAEPVSCKVGTSQISLGARVFCREEGKNNVANTKVTIYEGGTDGKISKVEETVTIDKNGVVQGLKTKLESGNKYVLTIQAPNTLRKNAVFTAQDGTTIVTREDGKDFILPVGDIAPTVKVDGKINTVDKAELTNQWRIFGTSQKILTGDLNGDSKVNSFDWACMRYDFNAEDDPIPSDGELESSIGKNSPGAGQRIIVLPPQ